jgi:hypothetical protein
MFVTFGLVGEERRMTTDNAPADTSPAASPAAPAAPPPAPPSWPWRRAALFLAGAAQLITISALVSADPIPATWSSLLLAVAPAPLAAAVAPARVNLPAAAGIAVLIAGIAGQVTYAGLFFVPALVVLAVAAVKLWGEQDRARVVVVTGRGHWDVEYAGLPSEEIELRVFGNGQHYGRFMLTRTPGSRPTLQARLVAVTLAEQAGRALAAGTPIPSTR